MQARAAVLRAINEPLTLETIEVDEPRQGEVLVRTEATGVCHSDLHIMQGEWPTRLPIVLGHESAGIVEQVGPGVTNVQPGDRVVVAFRSSCGQCQRCVTGRPVLCLEQRAFTRKDRLRSGDGLMTQFMGMSAFADHQLVSAQALVHVPDGVPAEVAALVGCSVMTGVGAVTNTAKIPAGSVVAVIGCGGVGLNIVQGAVLAGAARIIAVDLSDTKLAASRQFGATDTVNGRESDAVQAVIEMTDGGVDYAFEAIGLPQTVSQAFAMLRTGGLAVVVGMLPADATIELPRAGQALLQERGIIGSSYGSTRQAYDMPWLMELYRQKRLKIDELITRRYPLEEVNEAYRALKAGEVNRSVLIF
jgi:S-(hydroxymethyl)glutathione dehydrogenase/alcohol dehydrogenase